MGIAPSVLDQDAIADEAKDVRRINAALAERWNVGLSKCFVALTGMLIVLLYLAITRAVSVHGVSPSGIVFEATIYGTGSIKRAVSPEFATFEEDSQ